MHCTEVLIDVISYAPIHPMAMIGVVHNRFGHWLDVGDVYRALSELVSAEQIERCDAPAGAGRWERDRDYFRLLI